MKKIPIVPPNVDPVGPYSPAVVFDSLVFVSGQGPRDLQSGELVDGFENQVRQALQNLKNVLESSGSSLENVLKVTPL